MAQFSPEMFTFLDDLAANNNRDWFNANKARFESDVKAPLHAFVAAIAPLVATIDPAATCDAKSVFRIYRDTRFGADKSPYKTHAAAQFSRGRDHGPAATGYYLHLQSGGSFFAGGLWLPEPKIAAQIRTAIDASQSRWVAARDGAGGIEGDQFLARVPRGFAPEHPLATDLRRKSFTAWSRLSDEQVLRSDIVHLVAERVARIAPLVKFLAEAVGTS